jgi:hypothetical protein
MSPALPLSYERYELVGATQDLVSEFAGLLPAGVVIACVVRCRDVLERNGTRSGLAAATTAMARRRLLASPQLDALAS